MWAVYHSRPPEHPRQDKQHNTFDTRWWRRFKKQWKRWLVRSRRKVDWVLRGISYSWKEFIIPSQSIGKSVSEKVQVKGSCIMNAISACNLLWLKRGSSHKVLSTFSPLDQEWWLRVIFSLMFTCMLSFVGRPARMRLSPLNLNQLQTLSTSQFFPLLPL